MIRSAHRYKTSHSVFLVVVVVGVCRRKRAGARLIAHGFRG